MPGVRIAGPDDVDRIVDTMTSAFFHDPMWGPAFPDVDRRAEQASALWRLFVTSALRYPWMFVTDNIESAALWITPHGHELTPDEAAGLGPFLDGVAGPVVAAGIMDIFDRLDAAHPVEPHFYLSLLATHDDHRGHGIGMALLADNLARIDALHAPAYLESCNPANNKRYETVGFHPRDTITLPSGHQVTTMWRPAR
jgi:GNAT superfamily N-acetyltransferase